MPYFFRSAKQREGSQLCKNSVTAWLVQGSLRKQEEQELPVCQRKFAGLVFVAGLVFAAVEEKTKQELRRKKLTKKNFFILVKQEVL